jgi:hypothetical protein
LQQAPNAKQQASNAKIPAQLPTQQPRGDFLYVSFAIDNKSHLNQS